MMGGQVITELLGRLVSVRMWVRDHSSDSRGNGEFRHIMNGTVRSVGIQPDSFVLMIEAEPGGNREPGSLSVFTLGARGGCEICLIGSQAFQKYTALRSQMKHLLSIRGIPEELDAVGAQMAEAWSAMSAQEQANFSKP